MSLRHQVRFGRGFDHQRQFRGGFGEADGSFRRGELRAVNNVAPVNQLGERLGVKSEFLRRDGGEKFGAGFVGRDRKTFCRNDRGGNARRLRASGTRFGDGRTTR